MLTAGPLVAVLDDEPEMRKALRRLLTCYGFRVTEYASGEELLAAVAAAPPACLLLDLHMPGVNGIEVLEALRSQQIPLPTVVITAHDEPGTAARAQALGACAYLKKPVDRDALLAAIATATAIANSP